MDIYEITEGKLTYYVQLLPATAERLGARKVPGAGSENPKKPANKSRKPANKEAANVSEDAES